MRILKFLGCAFMAGMVLLAAGCAADKASGDVVKVIALEKVFDKPAVELKLSDLASDIEYFALNTGDGFLPNYKLMDLIAVEDGFFLVPMPLGDTPFFKFSPDGVLQSQFSRIGRAEGEYVAPRSIAYSEEKDAFMVVDFTGPVMVFSSVGDYLYSVPTESLVDYAEIQDAIFMGDNIVFFAKTADGSKFCAVTVDSLGNILKEKVIYEYPDNVQTGASSVKKVAEKVAEKVCFWGEGLRITNSRFADSVLAYNNGELSVAYTFDYGTYKADDGERKITVGGKNMESGRFFIFQAIRSPKYFNNLKPNERMNYVFFNRESGECYRVEKDADNNAYMKNDLDGGAPFWPKAVANGKMYQMIDAIEFMELAEQCSSEKMKAIAATLDENSNPVLVVVKLKE